MTTMAKLSLNSSSTTPTQTVRNAVDATRVLLKDETAPLRYTDAQLAEAYNDFILALRRVRPDAYIGSFSDAVPRIADTDIDTTNFSFDPTLFEAAKYFMASIMQMRDDQFRDDGTASAFMQRANAIMITGVT